MIEVIFRTGSLSGGSQIHYFKHKCQADPSPAEASGNRPSFKVLGLITTSSNIFWISLTHRVKFLKVLVWIRVPAAEAYWKVFKHFISVLVCLLARSCVFPSIEAHNGLNIRRSGKARRVVLCQAALSGSVAQREVVGFAGRPNSLGLNPAKGKSWPTCIFVLEHGSCWIPDFHKERLRRAHSGVSGTSRCVWKSPVCNKGLDCWMIIRGLLLILF